MSVLKTRYALAATAAALVLSVIAISMQLTTAEETKVNTPHLAEDSVNEVGLQAVFHFRESDETVNSFKIFDTMSSGFDRTKPLSFKLEGVIGSDKSLLYKAIDTTFEMGRNIGGAEHPFSEFDVDVIFSRGDEPYRKFTYSDCQIKNYNIFTEYDKEETYNQKTDFAYIDSITFDCRGYFLGNPTYDLTNPQ